MITIPDIQGKTYAVFGLGKSGAATVHALLESGAEVFAWDDGEVGRAALDTLLSKGRKKKAELLPPARWPWEKLTALVLSPGIPLTHPAPHPAAALAKHHNVRIIGDIELLYEAATDAKFIGITGTNGKSTTTALIAHILKEAGLNVAVGGNLGTPVLELPKLGKDGWYVIETSSYQLDLIDKARFHIGVLLNLTPDHLDRHGDMEGYFAAKKRLFMNQRESDVAVVAVDDEYTRGLGIGDSAFGEGRKIIPVSAMQALDNGVYVKDATLHDKFFPLPIPNPQSPIPLQNIPTLTGQHNWQNAAAAYASARAAGVAPEAIANAMHSFPGLPHRMQRVAVINGVPFINDSKATNADAAEKAIVCYERIYWIAGGKAKAGGIASLEQHFPRIAHAYLIGDAADAFAKTLDGKVPYTLSGTLANAVKQAGQDALNDGSGRAVVLLSPACASFDQFKSFEDRGEKFAALVNSGRWMVDGEGSRSLSSTSILHHSPSTIHHSPGNAHAS